MAKIKLSTKLIWGMVILTTCMVMLATVGIVAGVFVLTERQTYNRLVNDVDNILIEHMSVSEGEIRQVEGPDGQTLGALLRAKDVSALITNKEGQVLAKYGIFKDLPESLLRIEPTNKGKYSDTIIPDYGFFDTYAVPIKYQGELHGYLKVAKKNDEIAVLRYAIVAMMVMVLPWIWGVSILVAYMLARRITRPMTRLVNHLENIYPESMQVITDSPQMDYEVSVVSKAINDLIMRLKSNLVRERQITENISHEFKTPLTRIASNLQVGRTEEAEKEVVELGGNVEALLSLAVWDKTEALCNLDIVIKKLSRAVPEHIKLVTQIPKKLIVPLPYFHASVIWRNLIDNAIKHNIHNGYIKIKGEIEDHRWKLGVVNSRKEGPVDSVKIVQRKYREGLGAGYGLGMSIVADMCRLHSLGLEVEERPGEMSVVISGQF